MKAKVTIGRDSHGRVNLRIKDSNSRQTVCEVCLTLEDYAMILTGMSEVEGTVWYGDLSVVGKHKLVEDRSITLPYYDKDRVRQYILALHLGDDWIPGTYLNSQKSIVSLGDGKNYQVNYHVHKYVDKLEE